MKTHLLPITFILFLIGASAQATQISDFFGDYKIVTGNFSTFCEDEIFISKQLEEGRSFNCERAELEVNYKGVNIGNKLYGIMSFCNTNKGMQNSSTDRDEHGISTAINMETTLENNVLTQTRVVKEWLWGMRIPGTGITKSVETLTLMPGNYLKMEANDSYCIYSKD